MTDRLDTKLWLEAHLREFAARGHSYYILHKGDKSSGTVALKIVLGRQVGCKVLTSSTDSNGNLAWLPALKGEVVPESEADLYLTRLYTRDPDVWAVELDSPDGSHPFPGVLL